MPAERYAIVGAPGAGKSTLARALAARSGLPWVDFDALYHLPDWAERPEPEFRGMLDAACPADGGWVADGNYGRRGGAMVRERADTIVWLDLPRPLVMARLIRRTLGRSLRGTELWNGNREHLRDHLTLDPDRSLFAWSWRYHAVYRREYAAQVDARWVRLRQPRDVAAWLASETRA